MRIKLRQTFRQLTVRGRATNTDNCDVLYNREVFCTCALALSSTTSLAILEVLRSLVVMLVEVLSISQVDAARDGELDRGVADSDNGGGRNGQGQEKSGQQGSGREHLEDCYENLGEGCLTGMDHQ